MIFDQRKEWKAWWHRRKGSLAVKLGVIVITVLFLMSMAFLLAMIIVSRSTREDQMKREAERLINGVETNINGYVDGVKSLSRSIMIDDAVVYYLRRLSVDAGITNDTRYAVMKTLNAYTNIDAVFVIRNDGSFLTTGRDEYVFDEKRFSSGEWKDALMDKKGGAVVCMDGNYTFHKKNSRGNLSVGRAIYDLNTQERTGFLLINISTNMMEEVIHNLEYTDICIVSENGAFLAGDATLADYFRESDLPGALYEEKDKQQGGASKGKAQNRQVVFRYNMPDSPLEIICRIAPAPVKIPATILTVLGILLFAFLVSFFVFGYFVIKEINHPIYELVSSMEETKQSGWLKNIELKMTSSEFEKLSDSYNSLIDYLNDLFNSLLEKEKSIQKAQMRVLHEQIKPHFLYNSLETISYMALESGADNVHEALDTLGSFYRNFLSKGDREIPLEREIRIVRDYLALQKLRYGEIIEDEYEIQEETMKCMIPKLLLQPLVENSIYHGIRPLGEPGVIRISSSFEGDKLKVSVYDSGIGMTEEDIENLLGKPQDSDEKKRTEGLMATVDEEAASVESGLSGFGLRGTIERIRYYCNSFDAIAISSDPGEYTRIDIYIPLVKEGNENV